MLSFICCLFAFVKVVRLGSKDRPCLRGQQVWHRVPVTRQGYAAGGPTHKNTRLNRVYCYIFHSTKVQCLQIMHLTILLYIVHVHLNTVTPFSPSQQMLGGWAPS